MSAGLTPEQLEQYRSAGYVCPLRAISREEALDRRRRLEAYEAEHASDAGLLLRIKGHLAFPWLMELARNPAILDALESVMGPNILLFASSLFSKRGGDLRYVSWHQDSAYFGLSPHEEITAWVALTDSTVENGCLRVIAGSHIGPDYKHVETRAKNNMLARGQTIREVDDDKAVDLVLEAGQFSLHHERMVHGSEANRSDDRRIGMAFFFVPTHVRSVSGRRGATLVRGVDTYHHWDSEPLPRFDLDPVSVAYLNRSLNAYVDTSNKQAAEIAASE